MMSKESAPLKAIDVADEFKAITDGINSRAELPAPAFDISRFQSSAFIKDINGRGQVPVYANQFTDASLLDMLDSTDVLEVAARPELGERRVASSQTYEDYETEGRASFFSRSMGRAALWGAKVSRGANRARHEATVETINLTSKIPGINSKKAQERIRIRKEAFDRDDHERTEKIEDLSESYSELSREPRYSTFERANGPSRWSKVRLGLAKAATWYKDLPSRNKEIVDGEGDSLLTRIRNRLKTKNALKGATAIGMMAVGVVAGAMYTVEHPYHRTVHQGPTNLAMSTVDIANAPVTRQYDKVTMIISGRTDGGGGAMYNTLENQHDIGGAVMVAQYSGQMAPLPGDTESTEQSIQPAIQQSLDAYYNTPSDKMFTMIAFSEGNFAGNEVANQVIANNGGVKPANFQYFAIASPLGPTGAANSVYAQAVGPILEGPMGIPLNQTPAPDTIYISNRNDPIGNLANQSAVAAALMGMDFGNAHNPAKEGLNMPCVTVRHDADGSTTCIIDNVHPVTEMLQANNNVRLDDHANAALQDFIPINDGSSNTVPRPNVSAGLDEIGKSIDQNTGTNIASTVVQNLPPEVKTGLQSVDDAVTDVPDIAAKIASGQENPITGTQQIMQSVTGAVNGVVKMLPNPQGGYAPVRQTITGTVNSYAPNAIPASVQGNANVQVQVNTPPLEAVAPVIQQGTAFLNSFLNGAPRR